MRTSLLILIIIVTQITLISAQSNKNEARVKYNNPDLMVDLGTGLWGAPIPIDYNKDGLMDIIMSCPDTPYKGLYYFENIGTPDSPLFASPIQLASKAYRNTQASYFEEKLHVFVDGKEYDDFTVNLLSKPMKVIVDKQPTEGLTKVRSNMWSYVDLDGDGKKDLVVGIDDWGEYGWDNAYDKEGKWLNGPLRGYLLFYKNIDGKFVFQNKIFANRKPIETYGAPGSVLADFNGNGKMDIITGEFLDKLTWYQNIGTKKKPQFAAGKHLKDEKGNIINLHVQMITPTAVDFNGDGHVDLLVGDEDGRVAYIQNTGKTKSGMPIFKEVIYLKQRADNLKFGALSTPYSIDWDGDGIEDLIVGNSAGNIAFFKNKSGGNSPSWDAPVLLKTNGKDIRIIAGYNGSIQGPAEEKWGYTTLTVADWDNDGKEDIIVNSIFGEIIWYKSTGDLYNLEGPYKVKVDWGSVPSKPKWNWWSPGSTDLVTQWRTTPFAIDLNNDGLMDLVMLDHEGYLAYYERFKKDGELWLKPGKRVFYVDDISSYNAKNQFTGKDIKPLRLNTEEAGRSGRRKICMVDWNCDGKIDLLVNSENACFFENVRQSGDSIFFVNRGNISKIKLAGHTTSPTPVNWNNSKYPDLLIGAEDGHFYLINNNNN